MDLRDKFIKDLFDIIYKTDKGNKKYEEMSLDDQQRARELGEGMLKRGWYIDPERI